MRITSPEFFIHFFIFSVIICGHSHSTVFNDLPSKVVPLALPVQCIVLALKFGFKYIAYSGQLELSSAEHAEKDRKQNTLNIEIIRNKIRDKKLFIKKKFLEAAVQVEHNLICCQRSTLRLRRRFRLLILKNTQNFANKLTKLSGRLEIVVIFYLK